MITDQEQIRAAIDYVFSQEMYLPVTRDTFEQVCPCPALAVHVTGRSAAEAIKLLRIEMAIAGQRHLAGVVIYMKTLSMTMMELEEIDRSIPPADHFRQCMSFARPEEGEIEIWLFAGTV